MYGQWTHIHVGIYIRALFFLFEALHIELHVHASNLMDPVIAMCVHIKYVDVSFITESIAKIRNPNAFGNISSSDPCIWLVCGLVRIKEQTP